MLKAPAFYPNVSLKLVNVLEDIGVNEWQVNRRRGTFLLSESIMTISDRVVDHKISRYIFGSQIEGTTTIGLESDLDTLFSLNSFNIIEDWGDWERGRPNIMIIQDEKTSPGYCLLQMLSSEEPRPITTYNGDMVFVSNDLFDGMKEGVKNGPAQSIKIEGALHNDLVIAFPCKTLPAPVKSWLDQQLVEGNISTDMKRYIESNKIFVVPVGRKGSPYETTEWRISMSHLERCIMLNINITQVQCYVMMKMILKTYLKHPEKETLSSFMCKNVLLHCIGKTNPSAWSPQNLLKVFTFYLSQVIKCIERGNCPHFFERRNNLMAGKLTPNLKNWLLNRLQTVKKSNGLAFLLVNNDDFGRRYNSKLTRLNDIGIDLKTSVEITRFLSAGQIYDILVYINNNVKDNLRRAVQVSLNIFNIIGSLIEIYRQGGELERVACRLLTPFFCSTLGSMTASASISSSNTVSEEALNWLLAGLHSDMLSSKLKLASIVYKTGNFVSTEIILRIIQNQIECNLNIAEALCTCSDRGFYLSPEFHEFSENKTIEALKHTIAFCVRFIPSEIHCVPQELQCEMFRSTPEDRQYRGQYEFWMDWAVVDSFPYFFFLQYKTYGRLHCRRDQENALNNLFISLTTRNLGHKETDLNLLGQCMEQENKYEDACRCYMQSLNIRPRNNSASLHLCRLFYHVYVRR